ncbi:MAG: hypothetical protein PX481_07035 [Microcystis sp. M53603_WE2]|jgi:hypothetical protein|uniref:Uncharacterized protein n=1 Tax=Microcystis aeruginosa PCC 9717 TaxID=1160286 RepID=I4FXW6_MICAE|nr:MULTISPECIES: hypothetical protein [Microcystis]MCE2663558.1 hypothetical protein [Microcystis sp. 53602_E8]MCZ8365019.1 hypothetical protein [Microcystis sp. LE19-251.1A]MDJ0524819.1 hypothetical protein [Microcystis sp. M53600_WE12]MDJ0548649.1 hypothetical protein [Microcystis sp. M49637_WE12]MCZ8026156.1 hypothetical protein [Microcystis sp. LE19-10.1B]
MLVKGIKKGKTIELLEEVDFPDNEELLVEIREVKDFGSALQDFIQRVDLASIDDDSFDNLRDKSTGRDVRL